MKAVRNGWWGAGAFAIGIALAAAPLAAANGGSKSDGHVAPLLGMHNAERIAGHYIVVLNGGASNARIGSVAATAKAAGGHIGFTYRAALKGFSASLSSAALQAVRSAPGVKYVEADARVHLLTKQLNPPSWGLDRVDQRNLPMNQRYKYVSSGGSGVKAYVLDTGMRFTHTDFGGRATSGFDAVDGGSADDCNGHGTHTSGTTGGTKYGVAKKVSLIAVRVLDCGGSGSWGGVIAGINWVTANHSGPSVANMSLGGGHLQSVDDAVTASINSGVVYAVSAGNNNTNACTQSPASTPLAITVGATETNDARASYSNYGTCLDLFAPGSGITSDWYTSDTATAVLSGTSMASPHVAGVAALVVGEGITDPDRVERVLKDSARKPDKGYNVEKYGAGIVDAPAAVLKARAQTGGFQFGLGLLMAGAVAASLRRTGKLAAKLGPSYLAGVLFGASGLFFLPYLAPGVSSLPVVHALTHGLPSWDLSLLGPAGHGSLLFFSALVPVLGLAIAYGSPRLRVLLAGLSVGIAAHLAFFAAAPLAAVHAPAFLGATLWLGLNALICLGVARLCLRR